MSEKSEWCWSYDDGDTWQPCASREEAIATATADGHETIRIGRCSWASHENLVRGLGEDVRDCLANVAYEDAGEHADNYPDMKVEPFDKALEAFVLAWLKEHAAEPRFFSVHDEEGWTSKP